MSTHRISKRARVSAAMVTPSVGMKLCVGDRVVPLEQRRFLNVDGDEETANFVKLTSRKADLAWLQEALGLPKGVWRWEAARSPLVKEFSEALAWKRSRGFARVLRGKPLTENMLATVISALYEALSSTMAARGSGTTSTTFFDGFASKLMLSHAIPMCGAKTCQQSIRKR